MKKHNISEFTRGWIAGIFEPSLIQSDIEVGIMKYSHGEKSEAHYHKEADEINVIVKGRCLFIFYDNEGHVLNEQQVKEDEILIIEKGEIVEFRSMVPSTLLVIKTQSIKGDKYIMDFREKS